ncbi:hypothetical protein C2845_PM11G25970 [Panicum miliaceum]|uniref:Uncharacterized protein n=1 Tax=Panicum miliaceum TaxID=4540 RepID=A0A3L6RQL5_PANMI|nr:hypothetical protein C2845_PM11G25970 [Panicum miliaceum]
MLLTSCAVAHIMFHCPYVRAFWAAIGVAIPSGQAVADLQQIPRPAHVPAEHSASPSYATGCCGSAGMESPSKTSRWICAPCFSVAATKLAYGAADCRARQSEFVMLGAPPL